MPGSAELTKAQDLKAQGGEYGFMLVSEIEGATPHTLYTKDAEVECFSVYSTSP